MLKFEHAIIENFKVCAFVTAVLCLLLSSVGIFDRDLWTPDEPRVAAMSMEMYRSGNYIVPHLAGEPFVEKPPLYFFVGGLAISMLEGLVSVAGAVRITTLLWGLGVLFFTFLTACRLWDRNAGIASTAILATMLGFVENFHWIRVDSALAFFVMAAVWCSVEAFWGARPTFFLFAGVFSAGAFLSKGFIGPVLIAIPVSGLILSKLLFDSRRRLSGKEIVCMAAGFLLFLIGSGIWVLRFRANVSPATWHEWFWINHLGRFTGEAVNKGHMRPGNPFYYIKTVLMYGVPWSPFIIMWIVSAIRQFKNASKQEKYRTLFLLMWGVGSLVLLTIPSTKRDLYLLPVLPVFAIMASSYLRNTTLRWINAYVFSWIILSILLLGVFTFLPWISQPFINRFPEALHDPVSEFNGRNALCGLGVILCTFLASYHRKKRITGDVSLFFASIMLFTGLFLVPMKIIDYEKNLFPETDRFLEQVTPQQRVRIAGWNFSQTMLGCFVVYGDWCIPQVQDKDNLRKIIEGTHPEFDSVIVNRTRSLQKLIPDPYELLLSAHPRKPRPYHSIFWIKGVN